MSYASTGLSLDPVTFEVLKNSFISTVDQMAEQVLRTCYSFVIYNRDFSSALNDANGDSIAQGNQDIAVHVGTLHYTCKDVIRAFKGEMAPGDVYIINDPYAGGTHFNDVRLIRPIFVGDEIIGFSQSNGHWSDVGGSVPGSFDVMAKEMFREGIRITPVRIIDQGVLREDGANMIAGNTRDPKSVIGDMRAQTEATRALAYYVAAALDAAKRHENEGIRKESQALVDLLVPVVKAWSTDTGIEVANTGIQVLGGAGYIEESGAPQFLRDIRVAAIYEGTNGIQAMDLIGRKVAREDGVTAQALIADMRALDGPLAEAQGEDTGDDTRAIRESLTEAVDALAEATDWIVAAHPENSEAVAAGAVPYLRLLGLVAGGWLMAKAALAAGRLSAAGGDDGENDGRDQEFLAKKIVSARFYADHLLVQAPALSRTVTRGWNAVSRFS